MSSASTPSHLLKLAALPCAPGKIIGIGSNYRAHALELGHSVPTVPLYFLKPPSSLIGSGGTVVLPPESERVDYEGELGIVIGKRARRVDEADALSYVAGYVVACDVTARDLQNKDGQWSRAKGFDTFCPLSERIVKVDNPDNLMLTTTVNGVVRQSSNTCDMVFGAAKIVSHVSQAMTLFPGDLILTGTPSGVGPLQPGDQVTVTISEIGSLTFSVAAE
jgi:2-keto-4-pentenoate hydratase/2-oxohepta-3-ene-1,7-dioic acid hydratase in catechol pathway